MSRALWQVVVDCILLTGGTAISVGALMFAFEGRYVIGAALGVDALILLRIYKMSWT